MVDEKLIIERNSLIEEAQAALDDNKLEEAEALQNKVTNLDAKIEEIKMHEADVQALENVMPEAPAFIMQEEKMEENKMEERLYNASSVEYRNAWLKNMAVNAQGKFLVGEPTVEETNAYTFTTANSGSVVPTEVQNKIIELVQSMAPIYADATKSGLEKGFAIPRHKSIDAGDAAVTDEGAANSDEQDTFDQLALDGVEIKKHIKITKKMQFQSIDSFESWIVDHIAKRIANAKEARILSQLSNTTYGIAAANVLSGETCDADALRKYFGLITEAGTKVIYANNNTIWNKLFAVEDKNERPLFIPSGMEDPTVVGRIYGAVVKQDENIPTDTIYVGVPASIIANDFCELETARDMDATSFVTTISGYSLFDAGLENPLAFVKASF